MKEFVRSKNLDYVISNTVSDDIDIHAKNIFIFTPERALQLIALYPDIKLDFFFFDEMYKEDEDFATAVANEDREDTINEAKDKTSIASVSFLDDARAKTFRIALYLLAKSVPEYYLAGPNLSQKIRANGSKEKKEEERLKQFFYSFEFHDIQTLLFTPSWTPFDEDAKKKFLDEHQDLSKLSDGQLRKAFSELSIKSDWDRFFNSKVDIDEIEEIIESIRKYRNQIAHFKFFSKSEYIHCEKILRRLNGAIVKAIQITEEKDFASKNYEYIREALSEPLMKLAELTQAVSVSMSPSIKAMKQISAGISNVVQRPDFTALYGTMRKFLTVLALSDLQGNQPKSIRPEDINESEDNIGKPSENSENE